MESINTLFAALLAAATALPALAHEIVGGNASIAILDDPTKPYLTYFSPVFIETNGPDDIQWRITMRHDRVSDHSAGTIAVEIRSDVPYPQTILAATMPDGEKLAIDRAARASESCSKSEPSCNAFQTVFRETTSAQLLAANAADFPVKFASDCPFEIVFPGSSGALPSSWRADHRFYDSGRSTIFATAALELQRAQWWQRLVGRAGLDGGSGRRRFNVADAISPKRSWPRRARPQGTDQRPALLGA